ncbi:MAG: serine hydrolase domain-containing protein [Candidatus Thorarchaeota archaeon]
MKQEFVIVSVVLMLFASSVMIANPEDSRRINVWPSEDWEKSTPEDQGLNSTKFQEMNQFLDENETEFKSVLVVRNGYIVFEKYFGFTTEDTRHIIYSCTKSFTSALIGIALDMGYIDNLNQRVVDILSDWTFDNMDSRKGNITIEHLLTMTSGLDWTERPSRVDMEFSDDWVQYTMDLEMVYEPGTHYEYNTGGSHLLSAIINVTTGMTTLDFAEEHLFGPIGIQDPWWPTDPLGINAGGHRLGLRIDDMARLGYLYLNNGTWDDQQVVPKEYVLESIQSNMMIEANTGYGYQWWISPALGVYSARGAFGQYIVVCPEQEIVVCVTSTDSVAGQSLWYMVEQWILSSVVETVDDTDAPLVIEPVLVVGLGAIGIVSIMAITIGVKRK